MAKWKRGCLQNSYAGVRFPHAPQKIMSAHAEREITATDIISDILLAFFFVHQILRIAEESTQAMVAPDATGHGH